MTEIDLRKLNITEWAEIHAAFSNPKRVELMLTLYPDKKLSFNELKEELKIPSGTLNYHLNLLENSGLIENLLERRSNTISQYRLSEKGRKILEAFLKLLEDRGQYSG